MTGEVEVLSGTGRIEERILDNIFEIAPKSFFQTNSPGAEILYSTAFKLLNKRSSGSTLLDLYAGTGTIGIIFGKLFDEVFSVEIVADASRDARKNAEKNLYAVPTDSITADEFPQIESIRSSVREENEGKTMFYPCNMPTEVFLAKYLEKNMEADLLIIDPPRDGMHPSAPQLLVKFGVEEILYISCNPATLARDLDRMLLTGEYDIADIVPVDMFPHTHHIEIVVRLKKK